MSITTRRRFVMGSGLLAGAQCIRNMAPAANNPVFDPDAEKRREFFYRPRDASAGDFIPIYWDGEFHVFYLHAWRDPGSHREGVPWYRISTTDFVHFREQGEVLPQGSKEDQDLYVFTGSVLNASDGFHIFYTGHNHHLQKQGKPMQGVMHAVSRDLQNWTKKPGAYLLRSDGPI